MEDKKPRQPFKQKTSVASIYNQNTQIIKLLLQTSSIEKIAAIAKFIDTSPSIVLTEILLTELDEIKSIETCEKVERKARQYVLPFLLRDKLKHVAVNYNCHAYNVVENCLNQIGVEKQNKITKLLLGRFRKAGII